jgi:hypothetical protein
MSNPQAPSRSGSVAHNGPPSAGIQSNANSHTTPTTPGAASQQNLNQIVSLIPLSFTSRLCYTSVNTCPYSLALLEKCIQHYRPTLDEMIAVAGFYLRFTSRLRLQLPACFHKATHPSHFACRVIALTSNTTHYARRSVQCS